jgi:DNA-binding MarR family transcriptional regulator
MELHLVDSEMDYGSPPDATASIQSLEQCAEHPFAAKSRRDNEQSQVLALAADLAEIKAILNALLLGEANQDSAKAGELLKPERTRSRAPDRANGNCRESRPPLPEPRLLRQLIRQRDRRRRYFKDNYFADPAWDMLLDLAAARGENKRVSVTSLCLASRVPPTTALRLIGQMTKAGLLQRMDDTIDRRRSFITISDEAANAIARYFADMEEEGGRSPYISP